MLNFCYAEVFSLKELLWVIYLIVVIDFRTVSIMLYTFFGRMPWTLWGLDIIRHSEPKYILKSFLCDNYEHTFGTWKIRAELNPSP